MLCSCICVKGEWGTQDWCRIGCLFDLVCAVHIFGKCVNSLPGCVRIYTAKSLVPPHCAALCWQWYTVGFLRATGGGWVHTVNYTSGPLLWFIALITVGSLKKEKGEEAYKIKKDWKCHSDRARGRIVCECMWGLLVCASPTLFTAVNYCGASLQLTVAPTEPRWRRRTSERSARHCADGEPAAAPPQIGLICRGKE